MSRTRSLRLQVSLAGVARKPQLFADASRGVTHRSITSRPPQRLATSTPATIMPHDSELVSPTPIPFSSQQPCNDRCNKNRCRQFSVTRGCAPVCAFAETFSEKRGGTARTACALSLSAPRARQRDFRYLFANRSAVTNERPRPKRSHKRSRRRQPGRLWHCPKPATAWPRPSFPFAPPSAPTPLAGASLRSPRSVARPPADRLRDHHSDARQGRDFPSLFRAANVMAVLTPL